MTWTNTAFRHNVFRFITPHPNFRSKCAVYLPVQRLNTLDKAWTLAISSTVEIWTTEFEDVELARSSLTRHPGLSSRDLLHLACCRRRGVERIHTFDRALRAVIEKA